MDRKVYIIVITAILLFLTLFGWQQSTIKKLETRVSTLERSLSEVQSELRENYGDTYLIHLIIVFLRLMN